VTTNSLPHRGAGRETRQARPGKFAQRTPWRLAEPAHGVGRGSPSEGGDGRVFGSWTLISNPARARLLDPLVHLRSLRLLQGVQLDVAGPFRGSKRRRRVEFRTAEEDDIHGDVVGDHLDDPPEFWQPVVRLLPLDGVLKGPGIVSQITSSSRLTMGYRSGISRRIQSSMSAWLSDGTGGFWVVLGLRGFAIARSSLWPNFWQNDNGMRSQETGGRSSE
jgi:hypothetical protein